MSFLDMVKKEVSTSEVISPPKVGLGSEFNIVRNSPNNASSFTENTIIRIPISPEHYINGANSTLNFKVITTGTSEYLDSSALTLFQRIGLRTGSGIVMEEIIDFNVKHAMDIKMKNKTLLETTGLNMWGCEVPNTTTTARDDYGPDGRHYCFPMSHLFGLFATDKLIPNKYLPMGVVMELTVGDATQVVVAGADDAVVTISEVYAQTEHVKLSDEIDMLNRKLFEEKGFLFKYSTFQSISNTIPAASTSINLSLPVKKRSVTGVLFAMRLATSTVAANAVQSISTFSKGGSGDEASTAQWINGVQRFPQQALDLTDAAPSAYHQILKYMGVNQNEISSPNIIAYQSTDFFLAQTFDVNQLDDIISGINTTNTDLQLALTFIASTGEALAANAYVQYDTVAVIGKNGVMIES